MKGIGFLFGFLVLIGFGIAFYGNYEYQYRQMKVMEELPMTDVEELDTLTPVIEYKGKRYRRNSYIKAILLIGVDSSGDIKEKKVAGSAGQADGLFLVVDDTARNKVKILMIPRDTMTEITLTDLAGNELGKDVQHITLAYAYGDGEEKSCNYLRAAVSNLLGGLSIEHYMAANTSAISVLNDGVGGVPVIVDTSELEQKDETLKKGKDVILNGSQAELYVRYRDVTVTNSALSRMDRQRQYMKAFMKRLQENSHQDNSLVRRLTEDLQEYLITDMDKSQYLSMAKDVLVSRQFLKDEDIYMVPGKGEATDLYDEFQPDMDALRELVLELFYREVK